MTITILDRLIEPLAERLTMEASRTIVALKTDDASQQYVDGLADKANPGTLTEVEKLENDQCLAAFHFITVMQARARRLLTI